LLLPLARPLFEFILLPGKEVEGRRGGRAGGEKRWRGEEVEGGRGGGEKEI
jgi:hypothetical protein